MKVTDPALIAHLNSDAATVEPDITYDPQNRGLPFTTNNPDEARFMAAARDARLERQPAVKLSEIDTPQPRVTDDMGTFDRLLAGYGRGVATLGEGLGQIGMHVGQAIGSTTPEEVRRYDQQIADEAQLYNADLGKTGAGQLGNFMGQAITTLPVGEVAFPAKAIAAGAGTMARLGTHALNALGKTGTQGAIINAAQPVEDVKAPTTLADLVTGDQPQGEDFATAKAKQAAEGAALGAGTNLALRGAGNVVEAVRNLPTKAFRDKAGRDVVEASQPGAGRSSTSDFIDESNRLSQETGVQFTPGQESGSKGLTTLEQKARQSGATADQVFEGDKAATQQLDDYIQRAISNVSKNASTPEETGDLVRDALNKKVQSIAEARKAQAAVDYGAVRDLTRGAANIEPTNANALLQDILDKNSGVGSKSADALARFAKKQLANIAPGAKDAVENPSGLVDSSGNLFTQPADAAAVAAKTAPAQGNLDKLIKLRSFLSEVAGGKQSISGGNVDRMHAAQLLSAIDNDLASAEGIGGKVGAALKTANANYKNASQQIEYVKTSPLGKLLGKDVVNGEGGDAFNTISPLKLIAKLKSMDPAEVSTTRALMQEQSPGQEFAGSLADAWQQAKRTIVQDALEKARTAAPSAGANTLVLQPGGFIRALGAHTPEGQAWAKALFEPNELAQIKNAIGAAQRLGDKTGYNFSGTAAQLETPGNTIGSLLGARHTAAGAVAGSLAGGLPGAVLGTAAGMATKAVSKKLADKQMQTLAAAMVDPNGRKALLQLERLPPGAAKARELTAYLATFAPVVSNPGEGEQSEQEGQK